MKITVFGVAEKTKKRVAGKKWDFFPEGMCFYTTKEGAENFVKELYAVCPEEKYSYMVVELLIDMQDVVNMMTASLNGDGYDTEFLVLNRWDM